MEVTLNINQEKHHIWVDVDEMLVDTLRRLGYKSVKKACDSTACGACNVWVNNKVVPSCAYLTVRGHNQEITTIEGLQDQAESLAQWIVAEGAEQCGFCSPGQLMTLLALFQQNPNPSMDEVKHFMAGNLCRCSGYVGQHRGIEKYLEVKKHGG